MDKISVSKPFINEEEKNLVLKALNAGEISGNFGSFISEFEEGFAHYCGSQYGISVANGTVALHLALVTLGIGKGDEVLVSTFTNMATFFAVLYTGAKPIPIDIEPDTWNLDPRLLESKINSKTKAVIPVHIYGHPVDIDPLMEIARKHNLFVIEDAAEAHGAEYKGKRVGSFGDINCFSFYANKILTTGEGGMLITNNKDYADRARSLKSLAFGGRNKFMHKDVGFNYRMTNLQAALGAAQLGKVEKIIEKKRYIAQFYKERLSSFDIDLPTEKSYAKNVYWMFHVVLKNSLEGKREKIMELLKKKGIETREAFIPFNMQQIFIDQGITKKEDCPNANYVAMNGFYVPSGPVITDDELEYIVNAFRESVDEIK